MLVSQLGTILKIQKLPLEGVPDWEGAGSPPPGTVDVCAVVSRSGAETGFAVDLRKTASGMFRDDFRVAMVEKPFVSDSALQSTYSFARRQAIWERARSIPATAVP
jgi:hypothetical protein